MSTTEQQFLKKVADVSPQVEIRQQVFPQRAIVLAVAFEEIGEITVPFLPQQAKALGECLIELAEQLAENETGDWN